MFRMLRVAAVVGVLFVVAAAGRSGAASQAAVTVAIDAQPAGNDPRTVGVVEGCVSAEVGAAVEIDVLVVPPGVPSELGVSGYEYKFFFDASVVTLTGENSRLLLVQAPNSSIVQFPLPLPNRTGEHASYAVDFGKPGIEPAGTSEVGPGVISRLTLQAEREGVSPLVLREVGLIDDASQIVRPDVIQAEVRVGQPCPVLTATPSPTPAATATPTPSVTLAATATPTRPNVSAAGQGPSTGIGVLPGAGAPSRLFFAGMGMVFVAVISAGVGMHLVWRRTRE